MAIIRAAQPTDSFTIISNELLQDVRLSYRARGLAAAMLSRPPGWHTDATTLARQGKEGRDAVRKALSELEAAGYLQRHKRNVGKGRFQWDHYLFASPQPPQEGPTLFD